MLATLLVACMLQAEAETGPCGVRTSFMNFLQMGRMSLASVAENIMTCLLCGVALKISWTSERMSASMHSCPQSVQADADRTDSSR